MSFTRKLYLILYLQIWDTVTASQVHLAQGGHSVNTKGTGDGPKLGIICIYGPESNVDFWTCEAETNQPSTTHALIGKHWCGFLAPPAAIPGAVELSHTTTYQ